MDPELKKIAEDALRQMQVKLNEAKQGLEAAARNPPSKSYDMPEWRAKLLQDNDKFNRELMGVLDELPDKAISRIEQLPEQQRPRAADGWAMLQDWVAEALQTIRQCITEAYSGLSDMRNHDVEDSISMIGRRANEAQSAIQRASELLGQF